MGGAHGGAPVRRGLTSGGGDHRHAEVAGGQLGGDGADTAGAAHHQQGLAGGVFRSQAELVGEAFPGGEHGQRQGGGFLHAGAFGHFRHQALVHALVLGVAALALHGPGVPDPVAGQEVADFGAYRFHPTGGIIAEYFMALLRQGALAYLGVHRVDRYRLHRHQQVAGAWFGLFQLDVFQGVDVFDGAGLVKADGLHRVSVGIRMSLGF